jgi:CheY-like chemotaxis protein
MHCLGLVAVLRERGTSMSLLETHPTSHPAASVLLRQVEALDHWNVTRHQRERLLTTGGGSREEQLDMVRRLQVLHHAHGAVLQRTGEFLAQAPAPMRASHAPCAVIAHRQEWVVNKLSEKLGAQGVMVVAVTANGAEALGLTVAEQPELLFCGDTLAMMTPAELLAEAALFSPQTVLAAQVAHGGLVGELLDAGAHSVVTRQIPPDEVAATLSSLVAQAG